MEREVMDWSCKEVQHWLTDMGFEKYTDLLCEEHRIDGKTLLSLTEDDLRKRPVAMNILGDIKRLSAAIDQLRASLNYHSPRRSKQSNYNRMKNTTHCGSTPCSMRGDTPDAGRQYRRIDSFTDSEDNIEDEIENNIGASGNKNDKDNKISEFTRTIISVVYMMVVLFITSFVMTLAHDRVPDMKTYPPLPDVVLDNVPLISWAFELCELCALTLGLIWIMVLIFHKHRMVLIRRHCALAGTVFLLRAVTMYVTSMSVPGVHLECNSQVYGNFGRRLQRALEIFFGMGMAISGVRTCGDYMFSGHTSVVTLLNFLITEYTPRRWYFLHTFSWILNVFAIFFILAAHEHYTIDVVIAFYISSRLFLYYHTLVLAPFFNESDRKRTQIWFPLFWFFERNSIGRIPNEYEWPFTIEKLKSCFKKNGNEECDSKKED